MNRKFLLSAAALCGLAAVAVAAYPPARDAVLGRFGADASAAARLESAPEPTPPAITVMDATIRPFRDQLFVSGTLVAREDALVGVQIDGLRISEVLAEDGDTVRDGQVLARLDRTQLDALVAQSEAAVARADAAIQQAKATVQQFEALVVQSAADYERGKQLGQGVITQSTLEQRLAAARSNEAQLEGARGALAVALAERKNQDAQRRELDVRLARTEVRAPVAGVISRRAARIGMLAMGSGDPLFRIIKDGALDLDAEAPDDVLARVKVGMAGQVSLGGPTDPILAGSVRLISSEVDRATRLGRVRIALPASPGRIGGFASAVVDIDTHDGIAVPASAVTRGERGRVVQVVKDGRVEIRRVETGLAYRDLVELTEGVQAGETVVVRAAAFLRGGDVVRPIRTPTRESMR